MDLKWQDGAIPGKKLKKPSRPPEEVSQAKKQYEQKRSRSFTLHRSPLATLRQTSSLRSFLHCGATRVTRFFF